LFISGLGWAAGAAVAGFAWGGGIAASGRAAVFAAGRITGAGAMPLSAGIGLGATKIAGLPLLAEANCARLPAAVLARFT